MNVPEELHQKYVERRLRDLVNCRHFLSSGDFNEIEKLGHQIKGNASTFGHPELSGLGKRLEEDAKRKNISNLNRDLEEFSYLLKNILN